MIVFLAAENITFIDHTGQRSLICICSQYKEHFSLNICLRQSNQIVLIILSVSVPYKWMGFCHVCCVSVERNRTCTFLQLSGGSPSADKWRIHIPKLSLSFQRYVSICTCQQEAPKISPRLKYQMSCGGHGDGKVTLSGDTDRIKLKPQKPKYFFILYIYIYFFWQHFIANY